jgi:hypothetical protein
MPDGKFQQIEVDPRIQTDGSGCRVSWSPDFQKYLAARLTPEELQAVAECYVGPLLRGLVAAATRAEKGAKGAAIFDGAPARFAPSLRVRVKP